MTKAPPGVRCLATLRKQRTCASCARVLDSGIRETERRERAEAALTHLQATSEAAGRLLTRTTDERDEARQHAAAIAAQRDRLRQRMNALADRWDNALAVDKPYARTLRAEISVAPFHPDASLVVQQYRADDGSQKWAVRCWGTDTCDGFLSLDHDTERWAEQARDRHAAEAHTPQPAAGPTATQATEAQHGAG